MFCHQIVGDEQPSRTDACFCRLRLCRAFAHKAPQLPLVPSSLLFKCKHLPAKNLSSSRSSKSRGHKDRKLCTETARATRKRRLDEGYRSKVPSALPSASNSSPDVDNTKSVTPHNRFIFDINVHIPVGGTGESTEKMPKRILLDTGADINLISHGAFCDLRAPMVGSPVSIHSLAGRTSIEGQTHLSFNFLSSTAATTARPRTYVEDFFVISPSEKTLFDCILGHKWISDHWDEIVALMASRR